MKKKLLILFLSIVGTAMLAFGLASCSKVQEILLKAPENITYDGTYITWDKVDDAEYYMVQIGNAEAARSNSTTYYYEANGESFDVTVSSVLGETQESASEPRAHGQPETASPSSPPTLTFSQPSALRWVDRRGVLGFLPVIG